MSNAYYPMDGAPGWTRGPRSWTYPWKMRPDFETGLEMAAAGYVNTVPYFNDPMWHIEIPYQYILDDPSNLLSGQTATDYQILLGFWIARKGVYDDFLLWNPSDNTVTLGPQQLVTDSNGTYYTPLAIPRGGATIGGFESVTDLLTGSLTVYANGTPTTDFTQESPGFNAPGLSLYGVSLLWNAAPATPVTASFKYFYRVRFEKDDEAEFQWWSGLNSSTVRQLNRVTIKMVTSRLAPQL